MDSQWIKKAKELSNANFRIYGLGNFDINNNEVAFILELLEEGDFKKLKLFYQQLHDKRMGETT